MDKIEVTQAIEWARKVASSKPPRYTDASRNAARYILATRTDATPVAWMPGLLENAYAAGAEDVHKAWIEGTASNEPDFGEAAGDYARSIDHPPATDVAALVEAATGDDVDAWFQVGALKEQLRQANETIKAINGHLPAYAAAMKENKELKSAEADLVKVIRAQPYPESDDYIEVRRDERERIISALAPFTKGQNDDG